MSAINKLEEDQKEALPQDPESSRTKFQTVVIMLSLCAAVFLVVLDTTIVSTAIPTITAYFNASSGYTWISSAYLLANAASTPSWGKISDIWGRKPILLIAAAIFLIGSLLCGISSSVDMLIAARAIQGVGGGGLIVLVNIAISDLFSPRNRGKFFAMISLVWAVASAVGPLLGGLFSDKLSWRWCFYINLPITVMVMVALVFFLHLDNPKTPIWTGIKAVDWTGSLFIIAGTVMILLGLEFGGITFPWNSLTVIGLLVFGIIMACLFVLYEWKVAKYPVMPLRLFNNPSAVAAFAVCFLHGSVFIASICYLPLYFQAVLGATPLLSGLYIISYCVSLSIISAATGIFIKSTGRYIPPLRFGMLLMAVGTALLMDLEVKADWAKIIIYQIILGIGSGPNFQSPLIALQNFVAPGDIATATATFGFMRNLSTSISVVVGGVVFQNGMQKQAQDLISKLGEQTASMLSGKSAGASISLVNKLPVAQRAIAREAFNNSLKTMWMMYTAIAVLGFMISLFIEHRDLSQVHEVTKTGLTQEELKKKENW